MEPTKNRFSLTINDDDGKISIDIKDYKTGFKTYITPDELKDSAAFSMGGLSKLIILKAKTAFREVVEKK